MDIPRKPVAESTQLTLDSADPRLLANLCGALNENLRVIERRLQVAITTRGETFHIEGTGHIESTSHIGSTGHIESTGHSEDAAAHIDAARAVIEALYRDAVNGIAIAPDLVHLHLRETGLSIPDPAGDGETEGAVAAIPLIRTKKNTIKPRGKNQQGYVRAVQSHDINFGIGPAGTGKTYLAVACAVEALLTDKVSRLLLVRPAVEAGEKLGFLPGDLAQKIDPYLRPLYDALYEMVGFETVTKLIERNVIEIAPLAYMRGRTLNDSFIILDEAQNTTREQMKMFLTRIGFGSTAVITGDATQIDLPRGVPSGLTHAMKVLDGPSNPVRGISFTYFQARDVVRHPLVQAIVEAYEAFEGDTNAAFERTEPYKSGAEKSRSDKNKS